MRKVDWSVFAGDPERRCGCRCGAVYRSHAKAVFDDGDPAIVTQKPCPSCGLQEGNCWSVRSDPELYEI